MTLRLSFSRLRYLGFSFALLAVVTFATAQSTSNGVVTEPGGEQAGGGKVTLYSLREGDIHSSLKVVRWDHSGFKTVLYFEATQGNEVMSCPSRIPIGRRLALFDTLFKHLLSLERPNQSYSLFVYCYAEVDDRLPGLAAREKEWKALLKRKAPTYLLCNYIGELLNRGEAYPELADALAPFHYRVRVEPGGLEKLWTRRVSELSPEQRRLISTPVRENDILPSEVSKYYLLTKEP